MALFIVIIVFIVYDNNRKSTIKKLKKENAKLKEIIKSMQSSYVQSNNTHQVKEDTVVHQPQVQDEPTTQQVTLQEEIEEKNEQNYEKIERERKNTNILVVGAILIVLAAIVFLMSTWHTIGSFLKAAVLGLLVFVFLGMSKIAQEKYHLKKAGMAFFYIGMAYIPICLISFSVFGLLGSYFSIEGEGKFIYYSISLILTSIIYYFNYKSLNSKALFAGTILSQLFAIILFLSTFETNGFVIITALLAYNLILTNVRFSKDEIELLKYLFIAIPYFSALVLFLTFNEVSNWKLLSMILLAVNLYFNRVRNELNTYLLNGDLYGLGLYLAFVHFELLDDSVSIIMATVITIIIFFLEYLFIPRDKNKALSQSNSLFGMVSLLIIFLSSLFMHEKLFIVKPFVFAIIELVFMILVYIKEDDNWKDALEVLMPIVFIFSCCNIVGEYLRFSYSFLVLALLIFIISEILNIKNKRFKNKIFVISNTFTTFVFLYYANFVKSINEIIYTVSLFLVYGCVYFKSKMLKKDDVYIAYSLIVPLICLIIIELKFNFLIYSVLTICITYLSFEKRKISVETIIAGIYLIEALVRIDSLYIKYTIGILWCVLNLFFIQNRNERDIFKGISYILGYLMYKEFLGDYLNTEYKIFELLGLLILAVAMTRTIIKNYTKNIDIIEYYVFGIIYLRAIYEYYNEFDGMMFVACIVCLMFISYYKKYGAIFIVSLFAILGNALILTREFWLAIPWWIYLLVVGSVLITFAMKNESDENKLKKANPQNIIKNLKDKIESEK